MLKKISGILFLIIASYLGTYTLYKFSINPHLWLTTEKLFNGYFGTFTIVLIVFNGAYLLIIFLLLKYGLKWIRSAKSPDFGKYKK
jgi:hypothetical protein